MAESYSVLEVRGQADAPLAGRAWVRRFADGQVELLYKSGHAPGELEQLNAWAAAAGLGTRITRLSEWSGPPATPHTPTLEENAARALRRARQTLRWSVKAIGCDHMLTLTYRENVTDPALSRRHFRLWVMYVRRLYPQFRYVAVPELQQRGALHWHVACKGWYDYDRLRWCWYRAIGVRSRWEDGKPTLPAGVETPGNVQGNACLSRGRKVRTWMPDKLAGYLVKYLGKALGEVAGGASYSVSRGLVWHCERYAVRGLTFVDVACVLHDLRAEVGLSMPFSWTAPDLAVVWMAGLQAGQAPP